MTERSVRAADLSTTRAFGLCSLPSERITPKSDVDQWGARFLGMVRFEVKVEVEVEFEFELGFGLGLGLGFGFGFERHHSCSAPQLTPSAAKQDSADAPGA